jgi:hypothetical protein
MNIGSFKGEGTGELNQKNQQHDVNVLFSGDYFLLAFDLMPYYTDPYYVAT